MPNIPRLWWLRIPNVPSDVLAMADFIGSTSAIVDWCASQDAPEFIVITESGVRYSLEKTRARQDDSTSSPMSTAIAANART